MIKSVGIDLSRTGSHQVHCLKVAALRRYLRSHTKSDRVDGVTLAKTPFIDSEQLDEAYLPPVKYHALQRLTRQRERLMKSITIHKNRIGSIVNGYLPGLRKAFTDEWSERARAFYRQCLNPYQVSRSGKRALEELFVGTKARGAVVESGRVYKACLRLAEFYKRSEPAGMISEEFFDDLQDEIACELRLMEGEEQEVERVSERIEELFRELQPADHLRTIPGIGLRTSQVFLAIIGDPKRFRNQSVFAHYTGVVPGVSQSADTESKGLRMTKAGPAMMKRALFQAGDIGRRYDPQLAYLYYREVVNHGKTHLQAMGAVMSHLGARILAVLRENRPYEIRDIQGQPVSRRAAMELIRSGYTVPESGRKVRRRRKSNEGRLTGPRTRQAAKAPQSGPIPTSPMTVYSDAKA